MRRICVIGNSHIVAVRNGWQLVGPMSEGLIPTFFAAPGNFLAELELQDGKLVPVSERGRMLLALTSNGATEIDPSSFDAFVLVGMFVRLLTVVKAYKTHRLPEHVEPHQQVVSRSALAAAVSGQLSQSAAATTIAKLRSLTSAPIFLTPEPLPSESITATDGVWAGTYMPMLHDIYIEQLRQMAAAAQVELAIQPPDSMVRGAFTRARYAVGAVRLLNGKRYNDDEQFLHMNAEFGAEILREILPRLSEKLRTGTIAAS